MTRTLAVASLVAAFLGATLAPFAAVAAPRAVSAPANPTPAYDRCLATATGQTTMGMIQCAAAELKVQDARLNRAYQAAIARLERPRQKAALQKAQRAWIAFRDADCAAFFDEDWGSMARVEANACVVDHTVHRANALETFRKGY